MNFRGMRVATAATLGMALLIPEGGPSHAAELPSTPYFASLRSDKVNLRTGPGQDYPIDWVYQRGGLPVEVVAVFDTWRKIRDSEGTIGWINQGLLSGRRNVVVTGEIRPMRRDPDLAAAAVAQLEPGGIGRVEHCRPAWCEIKVERYSGWVERAGLWGLAPNELID